MTAYERRYPGAPTAGAAKPAGRGPRRRSRPPGWKLPGKYAKSPGAVKAQKNYRKMVAFYATMFIKCPEDACGAEPQEPCRISNPPSWYRCHRARWLLARPEYGSRKIPKGVMRKRMGKRKMHSLWDVVCVRCGEANNFGSMDPEFPLCPACLRRLYRPDKTEDWQLRVLRAELCPEWRICREEDGYFLVERLSLPTGRGWVDDVVLEGPASLDTVARTVLRWNWDIGRAEAVLRLMEKLPWKDYQEWHESTRTARANGPSWAYPYKYGKRKDKKVKAVSSPSGGSWRPDKWENRNGQETAGQWEDDARFGTPPKKGVTHKISRTRP